MTLILALLLSTQTWAADSVQRDIQALFKKYDQVMYGHDTKAAGQVFSDKFLKDEGGQDAFARKIKSRQKGKAPSYKLVIRQGHASPDLAFAKVISEGQPHPATFVLRRGADRQWRIEGTISDED